MDSTRPVTLPSSWRPQTRVRSSLDVRTADEYAVSHIDGATNVDIRSLAKEIDMVPTDSNTVAYCGSGHRAGMSLPALAVLDRASSKAYGGSYDSLVEAGAAVAAQ